MRTGGLNLRKMRTGRLNVKQNEDRRIENEAK